MLPFDSIPLLTVRGIATDPWLTNPMIKQPFRCRFAGLHFHAVFIVWRVIRIVVVVIGVRIPITGILIRIREAVEIWMPAI